MLPYIFSSASSSVKAPCALPAIVSGRSAESTIWLPSMTSTDFVLRPCVASMTVPLSFAFWTSLFTGAESGLTIAMIFDVFTIFPKPIWISLFT